MIGRIALSALVVGLFSAAASAEDVVTVRSVKSTAQTVLGSTVIPFREVTLTAQVPGRVLSIRGDVGTMISKGGVVAKIDDSALQAKKNAALSAVETAQASLRNSQAQYRREMVSPRSKDISGMPGMGVPAMMDIYMTRPMYEMMGDYDSGYNRYSDLMNSATGVSQAKGQVSQAWAQLNQVNAHLKNALSIAPFDSMILAKMVEVGDTVQPGQPIVRLGDVKYKRLRADVPSILVDNLRKGMVVPVKINGKINTEARIVKVYPIADPVRHTVTVKFDLYTNVQAKPGQYAEIYLPSVSSDKPVLVIPKSALIKGRSLDSVYRLNSKGERKLRLVRLGAVQGGGMVTVVSGLAEGDRIIGHPSMQSHSGKVSAEH